MDRSGHEDVNASRVTQDGVHDGTPAGLVNQLAELPQIHKHQELVNVARHHARKSEVFKQKIQSLMIFIPPCFALNPI